MPSSVWCETIFQRMINKMKVTLIALTVTATLFAGSASASDPDDLQEFKDTGNCVGCDLSGAALNDANLEDAILGDTTMPDGRFAISGC